MKLGDGLFLNTFRKVAQEYRSSGIEYNDMIVDNTYVYFLTLPKLANFFKIVLCNLSPVRDNSMLW